jgi:hypothetical protein
MRRCALKVVVDDRPYRDEINVGFYGIRIYPESIEDVAALERAEQLRLSCTGMERIVNPGEVHYLIGFAREAEE